MLRSLHVKNLALINETEVEFHKGLNILTGETGAGKSLLLGSVNLALGKKADKELIRKDEDYALVELVFTVEDKAVLQALKSMDVIFESEGEILISRKLVQGRSVSKVNGETVSSTELRNITGLLLDIHGQHEHQSLLYKTKHLEIVDEFAGREAEPVKEKLAAAYQAYTEAKNHLEDFSLDEEQRLRECSFLEFEIKEIEDANLDENEEERLSAWYKKASNSKRIMETVSRVYGYISSDGAGSAGEQIGYAVRELASVAEFDEAVSDILEQVSSIDSMLNDVAREVSAYMQDLEFDEEEFLHTQERLNLIHHLEDKYGAAIAEVLACCEEKKERLSFFADYELQKQKAEKAVKDREEEVLALCRELSDVRKTAAKSLEIQIKQALSELNFLQVQFEIAFEQLDRLTKNGYDSVEFLISTNPGETLKPLGKVASGGELSRIMLAIKTILSDKDGVETLIFDEIDSGISGITAQMVAGKLSQIAKSCQVLCITHLAQIASMADSHYLIEKNIVEDKTVTQVRELNEPESIEELARIVGGAQITDSVLSSAREMKEMA
ncbi:MAG: DNA repair protein RecN, partial [Lachnospiraceae bacterium]|nr:DNA repair protein RecN [Lachnospiraceae bacterium]